jgi:protein-S-isoprenylcysteine O-methyltransferase Ste14
MSDRTSDDSGVRLPPPLYVLTALLLGLGLGAVWPVPLGPAAVRYPVAAVLGVAGVGLLLGAMVRFRRAGTPLEPWRTTTALVIQGPYRFTRNPIYVGFSLVYLSVAFMVGEGWLLATLVPAMIALRYRVIAREERYLEDKFGDNYRRYKATVRRWL